MSCLRKVSGFRCRYSQWPEVLFQVEESLIESVSEPHDVEEVRTVFAPAVRCLPALVAES